ncbi:unnamed protein product [Rotaria sordida]|uniref:Uncharacterized protein n=1 Tax=Rotaria sordida TaxID=392033 RepID=A0A814S6M8_9BILA|nr:unnamed protein product [Rotaria sordida]
MTSNGHNSVTRLHASPSSSYTEQKVSVKKASPNIVVENKETPTIQPPDNNRRRLSGTFMKNCFNTTQNSKLRYGEKRKQNSIDNTMLDENENNTKTMSKMNLTPLLVNQPVLENEVNVKSTSNGEFKPKGILKNSKSYSCNDRINELYNKHKQSQRRQSYFDICLKRYNKENSNNSVPGIRDNDSPPSTSNTSTSVKSVTFSDMICEMESEPTKSMPIITKYSHSSERKSPNLHLMDTTKVNSNQANLIDKVQSHTID